MIAVLQAHAAYARLAFLETLAYRLRYVTGIATYSVYFLAYSHLWRAIYGESPVLGGFSASEMTHFVAVGWILRSFYFNDIDREVAVEIREGRVGTQLLRPVNYAVAKGVGAAGEAAFRGLFFTLPIALVVGWLAGFPPPADAAAAAGTAASALLALVVMSEINILTALAAFPLKNIEGIIYAKYVALQLLSGLLIPLSFFPPAAARILEALPFAAISQTPVLIYLGKVRGGGIGEALLFQAAWAAALALLIAAGWRRAIRRLTVQGG